MGGVGVVCLWTGSSGEWVGWVFNMSGVGVLCLCCH